MSETGSSDGTGSGHVVRGGANADPPVVGAKLVDAAILLLLLGVAVLFAWDSWRTGATWASDGPRAGYFPFYLALIMGAACLWGLVKLAITRAPDEPFITRQQGGRVALVLLPTIAFCLVTQVLGIYVSSFLLVSGFMWWVGRISALTSLVTAAVFAVALFATFEIAFKVIMPKGPLEAALGF